MNTPKFLSDIVIGCGRGRHQLKQVFNSIAVLSGSALLKHLTGGSWSTGDIDFFVTDAKNTMHKLGLSTGTSYITKTGGYSSSMNNINCIYTLRTQGLKIQFIEIAHCDTHDDLVSHIFKEFDMDICKNAFWITQGESHLQTYLSLNVLESKKSMLQYKDTPNFGERIEKYESRGFTFVNKHDIVVQLKNGIVTVPVTPVDVIPSMKFLVHPFYCNAYAKELFAKVTYDDQTYLHPCFNPVPLTTSTYVDNPLFKIVHGSQTFIFYKAVGKTLDDSESVEEDVHELDIGECRIDDSESSESDSEPEQYKKKALDDSESSDVALRKITRESYARLAALDILLDLKHYKINVSKAAKKLHKLASRC